MSHECLIELLLCSAAVWAIVEVWHHGSIFSELREYLHARGGFIGELSDCPYCLSHWIAAFCVVLSQTTKEFHWGLVPYGIILWFATTRLANLLNDGFYFVTRTPKDEDQVAAGQGDQGIPYEDLVEQQRKEQEAWDLLHAENQTTDED